MEQAPIAAGPLEATVRAQDIDPSHPQFIAGFKAGHEAGRKRGEAAEREACAKACEAQEVYDIGHPGTAFKVQGVCIDAIRARSNRSAKGRD